MGSERDQDIARLCLERGYATPAQVRECLKESSLQGAILRPLESILRRRGYISEDAYRDLARRAARREGAQAATRVRPVKTCETCGTPYPGELCPKCLAGFAQQDPDLRVSSSPDPGP
jgi:hypothetical protein